VVVARVWGEREQCREEKRSQRNKERERETSAGREGERGIWISLRLFFLNLNDYIVSLFIVPSRLAS
jgi:hypothetical protein